MVKMTKEADSATNPEMLTDEMKLEESSNDMDHNSFQRGDEVELVGDGVPGYETTGEEGTDDLIEDEKEEMIRPKPQ